MSDYFIGSDAHGDPWVWRKNGDQPIPILSLLHPNRHPDGRALLDLIRAAVEGEVREEWGVRTSGHIFDGWSERCARSFVERRDHAALVRRTVITGAWEEER